MRPSLILAVVVFVAIASSAFAAPATLPPAKIATATQSDQGCPHGSHRDPAAVDKAGGDKAALASVPCVPDSSGTQATGTVDGAGIKPVQLQPPVSKPLQVQPPAIKPH